MKITKVGLKPTFIGIQKLEIRKFWIETKIWWNPIVLQACSEVFSYLVDHMPFPMTCFFVEQMCSVFAKEPLYLGESVVRVQLVVNYQTNIIYKEFSPIQLTLKKK